MLKIWAFAAFASALSMVASQNVTVDDLDSSIVLSPLASWAWSNQGVGAFHNTFSFSNDIAATVQFTFPQPATGVSWRGFKRSGAALYSICIDCSGPNDPQYELVDGHDSNAQPNDSVTTLFSKQGLSNAIHNVTIKSLLDSRFLAASQITLDGFILTTSANESASAPTPPASTSMPLGPSSTGLGAGSPTSVSNLVHPSGTKSPIIIGVVTAGGVILVLGTIIGLLYWRRRRTIYSSLDNQSNGDVSPMMETLKTMPMDVEARNIVTGHEPYTDKASAFYQQFPLPPGNRPAPDAHVFSNITPGTRSRSPHGLYNHSPSDSTSSTTPSLFTMNDRRPSPANEPTTDYIPISLSNPFTNSQLRTEANYPADEGSDARQWYPSSIISDYSTDPAPTNSFNLPKPMPALSSGRRDARPVSSGSSVYPSASLRVSAIVDAMRDVMTTRSKTASPPQVVQEVSTRRPPGGSSPRQLSPPRSGGHSRSPSSSPLFF